MVQSFVILPPLFSGRIDGVTTDDLDLGATLRSGQAFRWTSSETGQWSGAVGARIVRLQQESSGAIIWNASGADQTEAQTAVQLFLRLDDADLPALARQWCEKRRTVRPRMGCTAGRTDCAPRPRRVFFFLFCAPPLPRLRGLAGCSAQFPPAGVRR